MPPIRKCAFSAIAVAAYIFIVGYSLPAMPAAVPSKHVVILRLIQSAFLLLNHLHKKTAGTVANCKDFFWILTAVDNCHQAFNNTSIDKNLLILRLKSLG